MRLKEAVAGVVSGHLTLKRVERTEQSYGWRLWAVCHCAGCDREVRVGLSDFGTRTRSCGCRQFKDRKRRTIHGRSASRSYKLAADHRLRCQTNKVSWLFESLATFAEYVDSLPGADVPGARLCLVDAELGARPGNLRWRLTKRQQVKIEAA